MADETNTPPADDKPADDKPKTKHKKADEKPAESKTRWTFWSKFARHTIKVPGHELSVAEFKPFVPGVPNMGKVVGFKGDRPIKVAVEAESQLYRGYYVTTDPVIGEFLEDRANPEDRENPGEPNPRFNNALHLEEKVKL